MTWELDTATAAAWLTVAALQGAFVIRLCAATGAILPATHALMFAIFLPILGATNALLGSVPGCDIAGLIGSSVGATLYVALFLATTRLLPGLFSIETWVPAIRACTGRWMLGCVALWVLVKGYLFATYGAAAIRALGLLGPDRALTTYAYSETIINALSTTLLQAVIFVWVLRLALRLDGFRVSFPVILALIVQLLIGDIDAGARRTIVALVLAYCLMRWWANPGGRITLIKQTAAAIAAVIAFSIYYPTIRANVLNPDIHARLASGSGKEALLGAAALFVPDRTSADPGKTAVLREGPMEFLCRLSEKQWERGQLTWGAVAGAALYISVPSVLLSEKITREPDEIMAETYDLFPQKEFILVDLATSPLAQLQSDFGPVGWILAPLAYGFVFIFFAFIFVCRRFSVLTRLLALGTLWSVAASPEATLTTAATGLRDFLLFAVLIELARRAHVVFLSSASKYPLGGATPG